MVLEILVIVDEIDLHARSLQRSDLYDERVVGVVDLKVHSRKADYFVKLVATLIDTAVFRHECAHFETVFLHFVWNHLAS